LNCGAIVIGRYCHVCGQENLEPKESVWHLAAHFFEDLTHFDGKFFNSLKYLLFKPGFLAEEYIKGKKTSYLNPIRMYLLTSAIFLLIFLNFFITPSFKYNAATEHARDSILQHYNAGENPHKRLNINIGRRASSSLPKTYANQTLASYDSTQKMLPSSSRDGWMNRFFERRFIAAENIYNTEPDVFKERFHARFFHSFSQIFLISLPFFALLLQLLYIRRKNYYYVAHFVFSIHFYCFTFLMILFFAICAKLGDIGSYLQLIIVLLTLVYLYIAMLRFYKQGWFKTLVKYFMLQIPFLIILFVLVLVFVVNSFLGVAEM